MTSKKGREKLLGSLLFFHLPPLNGCKLGRRVGMRGGGTSFPAYNVPRGERKGAGYWLFRIRWCLYRMDISTTVQVLLHSVSPVIALMN